jgi:hypothetical protein
MKNSIIFTKKRKRKCVIPMIKNKELELAIDFIERTDRNLFITGKAGTGKTTFLHKIKAESLKRMVVVAPTGVAAINAKGVTIHSFFQMPFGPILPNQNANAIQRKFSRTKIDIIRSLDLVIIDEISMVRADLLDGIDQVLRRYKDRNKVFGGAQVVMIGDLQQLAPVAKPNEFNLLKQHYETMYFFSSKAFQQANAISIELKHIYRQENEEFITILNEIRNDELTPASATRLNERFNPDFEPEENEGYITLTTHNNRARNINESKLEKLDRESHFFHANVEGNFSESSFPNSEVLELKIGAQVMFIKNDSSPEKQYFNGKIGTIVNIEDDLVTVQCPDDDFPIETTFEKWDNIKYSLEEETKEINEEIVGAFSQIPLRLAWAITIHKSQGLTFEKAIIDAGASFAHGQTYVALSRCTSLDGIVLKTKINSNAIINDGTVKSFSEEVAENEPDETILNRSEKEYQLNLMAEIFNYQAFLYPVQRMMDIYYKNRTTLQGTIANHLETIKDKGVIPLMKVAHSFQSQLKALDEETSELAEHNEKIQERFQKAVTYFTDQTEEFIKKPLEELTFSSDNKAVKKDFQKQFDALLDALSVKIFVLKKLTKGFQTKEYLQVRSEAVLQETEVPKKKKLRSKRDPILAIRLRELRDDIATAENIPHFQVFTQETLYAMCDALPRNPSELKKVKGMGKIRVRKYGDEILEVIDEYCKENGINAKNEQKKEDKKPSHQISLELFKKGFSIKEIAKERNLTVSTIESHLVKYIPSGDIDVLELIPLQRYKKLVQEIEATEFNSLKELKDALDDSYSYTELKIVLQSLE